MRYIECPSNDDGKPWDDCRSVFLAGGISGCQNWQKRMTEMLLTTDLVVLNPRRASFDPNDPNFDAVQIPWEHQHLRKASTIAFWFPPETVCPITLYELGTWTPCLYKKIFLGIDPAYTRKSDVVAQTLLVRPDMEIVYSLEDLAAEIVCWDKGYVGWAGWEN